MFWNLVSRRRAGPLIHLLMLAILALYTLLGAICFCAFEAGHEREKLAKWAMEDEQRKDMARERLRSDMQFLFVGQQLNLSRLLLGRDFQHNMDLYDAVMAFGAVRAEGKRTRTGLEPKWTLWGGLYFAGTIYTTIGYGDIVVETTAGKCFAVLYALLGIPLVITVLNVWGGGLFQLVQILWRDHLLRLMRSLPILGDRKRGAVMPEKKMLENGHLRSVNVPKISFASLGGGASGGFERPPRAKLPLKLAFILLLAWILLCATIFTFFQSWTFFDAAYFFFISLTTIGLGDYTAEHKVACAYFLLILIGLSVVSMSLNIIQLQIEGVFHKIIRSIDADFKSDLIAEQRKQSISTSIGVHSLQSQHSTMKRGPGAAEAQKKEEEEEDISDALRRYRGSMTRSERLLAQMMMGQHQRRILDEKLRARRRMKNGATQTEGTAVDAQVQTDQLNSLRPIASLWVKHSVDEGDSEEEEEEERMPANIGGKYYRRANTFSGSSGTTKEKEKVAANGRSRSGLLGRKQMYIYNTGD